MYPLHPLTIRETPLVLTDFQPESQNIKKSLKKGR